MAEPVWGLLQKAQDDSETIESAIARLIDEHDDDSNAHTETDQSLETHKDQTILDHPAGCVVADKSSDIETIADCSFESLDNWTTSGGAALSGWPGARLPADWAGVKASRLTTTIDYAGAWINYTKNMMLQITSWVDITSNERGVLMLGDYQAWGDYDGFGFELNGTVMRGFFGNGTTTTFTANMSIDLGSPHIYRAYYDADDEKVYFFVDGVAKGEIAKHAVQSNMELIIDIRFEVIALADGYMHIKRCLISRKV